MHSAHNVLLKVATLNTWHGLNGRGRFSFGLLESRSERMARLSSQVQILDDLSADVIMLQEVNPLPFRAHWYAEKLNKRCMYVSSNVGIKLGWGPPGNLNEGLAILFPQNWRAEFLGRKRLSGSFRLSPLNISELSSPFFSFQLHESRVALAVRLHLPVEYHLSDFSGAKTILFVTTHLHHAPTFTPRNQQIFADSIANDGLSVSEQEHVTRRFRAANSRRLTEVDNLASWIDSLRKPGESVVLGGDFNCEPDSAPVASLLRRGWLDSWLASGQNTDLADSATWNPAENPLAMRMQEFHQKGSAFSPAVKSLIQKTDSLSRRIDYLFLYPWTRIDTPLVESEMGCSGRLLNVSRFGTGNLDPRSSTSDNIISDHFGLVARFGY